MDNNNKTPHTINVLFFQVHYDDSRFPINSDYKSFQSELRRFVCVRLVVSRTMVELAKYEIPYEGVRKYTQQYFCPYSEHSLLYNLYRAAKFNNSR